MPASACFVKLYSSSIRYVFRPYAAIVAGSQKREAARKYRIMYDKIGSVFQFEQRNCFGIDVMNYFVRPMELRDVAQTSQIEREAFPPPWPATNFKREITSNSLTLYFVACAEMPEIKEESGGTEAKNCAETPRSKIDILKSGLRRLWGGKEKPETPSELVMGFAGLWFMADEAHLANIAVRESYRCQGIGERLFISAIELAIERKARFITLEVRASNKLAQTLYSKYGLLEVGKRRGYYQDNKEDAVIMTAEGITSVLYQNSFQKLKKAYAQRWGISGS